METNGVVFEKAESYITSAAQEPARSPCLMVVVYAKGENATPIDECFWVGADSANPFLPKV